MSIVIADGVELDRAPFGAAEHARALSGQLVLHPQLAAALVGAGFLSLEEVLALPGEVVSEHRRTRVLRLPPASGLPELYLKIHQAPDRKDYWFSWLRSGEARSSAEVEWRNLEGLAALGIRTPVPVALGCVLGRGRERVSFLATVALAELTPLDELLAELDVGGRRRALGTVVAAVAGMHAAGFTHPDLYARHVYLDETLTSCAFIDVQRTRWFPGLRVSRRARDLAALDVSLPPRLVSGVERLRFLGLYGQSAGIGGEPLRRRSLRRLARAVRRRRALLIRRGRGEEWKSQR